jgi:hypothetical protein
LRAPQLLLWTNHFDQSKAAMQGGAVFDMVGKSMSPMVDRLARLIEGDPQHEADFRYA